MGFAEPCYVDLTAVIPAPQHEVILALVISRRPCGEPIRDSLDRGIKNIPFFGRWVCRHQLFVVLAQGLPLATILWHDLYGGITKSQEQAGQHAVTPCFKWGHGNYLPHFDFGAVLGTRRDIAEKPVADRVDRTRSTGTRSIERPALFF